MTPLRKVIREHVATVQAIAVRLLTAEGWPADVVAREAVLIAWRDALAIVGSVLPSQQLVSDREVDELGIIFRDAPGVVLPPSRAEAITMVRDLHDRFHAGEKPDAVTRFKSAAERSVPVAHEDVCAWLESAAYAAMAGLAFDDEVTETELAMTRTLLTQWARALAGAGFAVQPPDLMAAYSAIARKAQLQGPGPRPPAPAKHGVVNFDALSHAMAALDGLVGLRPVKEEVRDLVALAEVRRLREQSGMPVSSLSSHMVFVGQPGTGKTSVARVIGEALSALGVVRTGHLVEVSHADLVGENSGQTAVKTAERVREALGGVMFLDEAYSLADGDSGQPSVAGYGHESITTLNKLMEDHRGEFVLIAAGYPGPMQRFLSANVGLRSKFARVVAFPDYTTEELVEVFARMCSDAGYRPEPRTLGMVENAFRSLPRDSSFGNAREARRLLEAAVVAHARRVAHLPGLHRQDLETFTPEDLAGATKRLVSPI